MEAFDKFRVLGLFLPVEILQLAANFDDAGKARTVLGAELSLFLLKIATPGVNLLEKGGCEARVVSLQVWIGCNDCLRITLRSGAILRFGENSIRCRGNELAAEQVDLKQRRTVLGFSGLAVRHNPRCAHDAVLIFKLRQALLVPVNVCLQICELRTEPSCGLGSGLNLGFGFLLVVGGDERVDDGGRKRGVVRAEAEFDQHGARNRFHVKAARETIQKPGLGIGRGLFGIKARKAAGKVAAEGRSGRKLERDNHAPGEPVAAKNTGQRFQCDGRGKNRGGNLHLSAIKVER